MQIDVDFDVYKALTVNRATEEVTYNDVLRELLGLGAAKPVMSTANKGSGGATFKGVFLPNGTQFRVRYKGTLYTAEIKSGQWVDQNGASRSSPSDAASAITKTQVNGWRFWEVKRPNDPAWRKLVALG
jgi:hypothetical protein